MGKQAYNFVTGPKAKSRAKSRKHQKKAEKAHRTHPASPTEDKMAPFKLENVIIISPGSRYVTAQMGVGESPTPPRFRFPSRMFPTDQLEQWEPVKIRVRKRVKVSSDSTQLRQNGVAHGITANGEQKDPTDTEMTDVQGQETVNIPASSDAAATDSASTNIVADAPIEYEEYFEEDPDSDEGAVWPIVEGRIENYPCFFALLTHVWTTLNPNFSSPVLIVAQSVWSLRDYEMITRLVFQSWSSPAVHIADAGPLGLYGIGAESGVVVDVGYDKCDITPIYLHTVDHPARRMALKNCGGNSMTKNLHRKLAAQGFDEDMAEQLKRSNICEILPIGTDLPGATSSNGNIANPAAAASTGATTSGANAKEADGTRPGQAPRGPGVGTEVGQGDEEENDGVLDIVSIVARDNAAELLAKREQEKAAKAAAKRGGGQEVSKQARLKNSEKERATFTYKEPLPLDDAANGDGSQANRIRKREIEVGVERFMAAEEPEGEMMTILEIIAWNIRSAIMSVLHYQARPVLWDNILVCGNGSRVKGFKEALYSLLISRYKLSPSTATIFTSELPSNFTTPVGTPGTNTPVPGHPGHPMHHPAGHGVNPLLLAATRNVMQPNQAQHLQVPGHATPVMDPSSRESRPISQTPSSIKFCKLPEYMPAWKTPEWANFEEASFAGAQVLAALIYGTTKEAQEGWYLTRTEFNEEGPPAITQYCLGWIS